METSTDPGARDSAAPDLPPLDMEMIARQALAPKVRRWRVGLDCDGKPYTWEGTAISPDMADFLAREELDGREPLFCPVRARTTSMLEV